MNHFEIGTFEGIGFDIRPLTLTGDKFLVQNNLEPDMVYAEYLLDTIIEKMNKEQLDHVKKEL